MRLAQTSCSNGVTSAAPIVYVVDDDPAVRDSLAWLLASANLDVRAFGSAIEFLSAYEPSRAACLVLDVHMPGIDGLELQRMLSARHVRLPVIFVTGRADVAVAERATKAGARGFFEKPFAGQALLDLVRRCLPDA
jgi:FixJ family two-component response regulator